MKKISLVFSIIIFFYFVKADIYPHILNKYKNRVLCIIGTGRGLNLESGFICKFEKIIIVDKEAIMINHTKKILHHIEAHTQSKSKEMLFENLDAEIDLLSIIKKIDEPMTILISNYYYDFDVPQNANGIFKILKQIKQHHIKNNTLLIDYLSDTKKNFRQFSIDDVKSHLLDINQNYLFNIEQGGHLAEENDGILAAFIN